MQRCRFVGIPGAGKTTRGMEVIGKIRDRGIPLMAIGYCTFTRAARREAAQRASDLFGVKLEDLERHGWFRTLHSATMRLLNVPRGAICNFDLKWLREALGDDKIAILDDDDDDAWSSQWQGPSPATVALSLWDVARNRMLPYRRIVQEAVWLGHSALTSIPCEHYVHKYEAAKKRDERLDFTDCILRYAGVKMTLTGPEEVAPLGDVPNVVAWIFDEAQDTSALLDKAAQRLASGALWLYLLGDPCQAIYSWAGADGRLFMKWPVEHEEYLTKSWRCSQKIQSRTISLIRRGRDEFCRALRAFQFEPRCEGGQIDADWEPNLLRHVDPHQPTLIMARTNRQAAILSSRLSLAKTPWRAIKTPARWPPLASTRTADAFVALETGDLISGEQWRRIVKAVPAALLVRGTKTKWKDASSVDGADFVNLASLPEYGGTEDLREYVAGSRWRDLVTIEERQAADARKKWGDLVDEPKVHVGTIHSTKGLESEKVILCTGVDGQVLKNLRTPEGQEEERRVWYVGASRARDHLVLLKGQRHNYEEIY